MIDSKFYDTMSMLGAAARASADAIEERCWYAWHAKEGIATCWPGPRYYQVWVGNAYATRMYQAGGPHWRDE